MAGASQGIRQLKYRLKSGLKSGQTLFLFHKNRPHYSFPQQNSLRFLKFIGDSSGESLVNFFKSGSTSKRNTSLLIHGFSATGPADASILIGQFDALAGLLIQAFPAEAERWLDLAAQVPPRLGQAP
ncbi:hypothetical protein [Rhodospirillum rubrum]|uniref:hypothetical protein n=1 Tax=Rhodospirillum rubrum TaxID=1085 RepID=UPI001391D4B3|nr:hypothetical protein [Rhodospirillum rubrum]QXG82478.1 hypothetical protein KUL73_06010 [Rhodospirillum rubrum]